MEELVRLVEAQVSPDNALRASAEQQFAALVAGNPTLSLNALVDAAGAPLPADVRQLCLLHVRRLVPQFWLAGFALFKGEAVDSMTKARIREHLVHILCSSEELKIRASASYVIVQIAAVDYPDEWPDLLLILYARATDYSNHTSVIGGLTVLTELFDDLISDAQFWEGGVSAQLIQNIEGMLAGDLPADIKSSALDLYLSVFGTLLSAQLLGDPNKKADILAHVRLFSNFLMASAKQLFEKLQLHPDLSELRFRGQIYKVMSRVISSFSKQENLPMVGELVLLDFTFGASIDVSTHTHKIEGATPAQVKTTFLCESLQLIGLIQFSVRLHALTPFTGFLTSVIESCILTEEQIDCYEDFNTFVTDISGLELATSVRTGAQDLLSDLNEEDSQKVFEAVHKAPFADLDWRICEAHIYFIECLLCGEADLGGNLQLGTFLKSVTSLISPTTHPLLVCRVLLFLPRFFEKYSSRIDLNTFGAAEFRRTFESARLFSNADIVRATALVCCTLWDNVDGFSMKRLGSEMQIQIVEQIVSLLDDAEDDTPLVLLEALNVAISIAPDAALQLRVSNVEVLDLIFKISFKDAFNIQVTMEATECLELLLKDVSTQEYQQICEKYVPSMLLLIAQATTGEYTPELYLVLEHLNIVTKSCPAEGELPREMFAHLFPEIKRLIMVTSDDQIMQNLGEVFNSLLQKCPSYFVEFVDPTTKQSGMDSLLKIAARFLSTDLSDSAAMYSGSIVTSLFEQFREYLSNDFFVELLAATVNRLASAKETVTIDNFITVLCDLVLKNPPGHIVGTLLKMSFGEPPKNGLQVVLPIWFSAFEVARGFEKIRRNVLALGKLFSLGDEHIAAMTVDGDVIPYEGDVIITRSKAKLMPTMYTQIPAPLKIIKLLTAELVLQCLQPDDTDFGQHVDEDDGDEEWEDMDKLGVPTYDELKSYVDSDEKQTMDTGIKETLIQFFRECLDKNLGSFMTYYEMLGPDEKKAITESLVF